MPDDDRVAPLRRAFWALQRRHDVARPGALALGCQSLHLVVDRVRHKRWNDPVGDDDGTRILISRFRPRGVPRDKETWTEWHRELSPSEPLHAAWYGKLGVTITFEQYRQRFLEEMKEQQGWIDALADRVRRGETITLLCSSACVDPRHCHRTLIKALVDDAVASQPGL